MVGLFFPYCRTTYPSSHFRHHHRPYTPYTLHSTPYTLHPSTSFPSSAGAWVFALYASRRKDDSLRLHLVLRKSSPIHIYACSRTYMVRWPSISIISSRWFMAFIYGVAECHPPRSVSSLVSCPGEYGSCL